MKSILPLVTSFAIVGAVAAIVFAYYDLRNMGLVNFTGSDLVLRDAVYHKALTCYIMALVGGITIGLALPHNIKIFRTSRKKLAEPGE